MLCRIRAGGHKKAPHVVRNIRGKEGRRPGRSGISPIEGAGKDKTAKGTEKFRRWEYPVPGIDSARRDELLGGGK